MKSTKLKYVPELNSMEIKAAADYFEHNNTFEYVDTLNWPKEFSYKPDCQFKIARSASSIFIHFKVREKDVRALYAMDQQPVWEDSCVEFFCKLPEQNFYYNFEFNCIGTCVSSQRESRDKNVIPFPIEKMKSIKRFASLGNNNFGEKKGDFEWTLTVEIPFNFIGIHLDHLPVKLLANFYKCGDGTSVPHYLSWNKISTAHPDFHRPEFFGEIYL
jgi:hypothetical protein